MNNIKRLYLILILLAAATSLAAETSEKLWSPDKIYSVEIVRKPSAGVGKDTLIVSKSGKPIAKMPTFAGPPDSLFEAYWSPDGKYVAINKQRSSRPGGDDVWVFALPSGKALKQPDDSTANAWEMKARTAIEKSFPETGKSHTESKEFLSIKAVGLEK